MSQPRKLICQALAVGLFLACAADPSAAGPGSGGETEVDRLLRSVVNDAKAKVNADDYEGALRVLVDAYERAPHPALLWPIAELYLQLQRPSEGLKILDRYVAVVPTNKMPPGQQLADVAKMHDQFRAQFGKLTITAEEPGATVVIDGKPVGQVPLQEPLTLDPGHHRVELQAGRSSVQEVRLKPGDTGTLHLLLAPDLRAVPSSGWVPHRRTALTAALVVGSIGLGAVIAGGVLWGLDGLQSCPAAPLCPTALDTKTTGIGIFAGGLGLSVASAILLGVELRPTR